MTDDRTPASHASAPPPMVPSAEDRAIVCIGRHIRLSESVERSISDAFRDGWLARDAALAAQPLEPQKPVIITRMLDGTLSAPPKPGDGWRSLSSIDTSDEHWWLRGEFRGKAIVFGNRTHIWIGAPKSDSGWDGIYEATRFFVLPSPPDDGEKP